MPHPLCMLTGMMERAEDHLPEDPRHRVCRAFFP